MYPKCSFPYKNEYQQQNQPPTRLSLLVLPGQQNLKKYIIIGNFEAHHPKRIRDLVWNF